MTNEQCNPIAMRTQTWDPHLRTWSAIPVIPYYPYPGLDPIVTL